MITIHKYTINPGLTSIKVPDNSTLRTCHEQHGSITLWFEVDTDQRLVWRDFEVYGTGWEIDDPARRLEYRGTVLLHDGGLVYHIYERVRA